VGFAPGFNLANYPINSQNASVSDPTKNVFIDPSTTTPLTHEFTTSYGVNVLNGRGYAEASYIYRKTKSFVEDFFTTDGGFTDVVLNGVSAGTFTNQRFMNSDLPRRQYQAMTFESRYSLSNRWNVNGNYTLQLKNEGNYEGEASSQPGNASVIGDYPEAFNEARSYPDGRLQSFQRHRFRMWSIYDLNLGRAGDVSVSGLWRVDSGLIYTLAARNQAITTTQRAIMAAAGYPDAPTSQTVFFADRGTENFKGYGLLDLDLSYNIPVFKSVRPWVKFDVYNLFDNKKLIAWSTTISQNSSSPKDNLGLATDYTKAATFGTATGNTVTTSLGDTFNTYPVAFNGAIPGGRTIRVAMGVRF
jgi:hypothetical protein